jgi:iron(III) transport system substrate-binding protein
MESGRKQQRWLRMTIRLRSGWLALPALTMILTGCTGQSGPGADKTVVVYSALDQEFANPVLQQTAQRLDLKLRAKFDIESTKTVGLTNTIIAEAARPRCDLFWNNEVLNTLRLKEKGLLQPFRPTHVGEVPGRFKDPEATWYGFAARARILLTNTKLIARADQPKSIIDLTNPRWKGKVGIAKPLFGTTATHAACLFSAWGDEKAKKFFKDLKANDVQVLSGNKQVATAVGSGLLAFGLTDTDDANVEMEAANPVTIVYPDREPGQLGTLFIPNTLAMIKGAPHPVAAKQLANEILSPDVEATLAECPSAQIPLLRSTTKPARVETPRTVHAMEVDFQAAAKAWDHVAAFLTAEFAD